MPGSGRGPRLQLGRRDLFISSTQTNSIRPQGFVAPAPCGSIQKRCPARSWSAEECRVASPPADRQVFEPAQMIRGRTRLRPSKITGVSGAHRPVRHFRKLLPFGHDHQRIGPLQGLVRLVGVWRSRGSSPEDSARFVHRGGVIGCDQWRTDRPAGSDWALPACRQCWAEGEPPRSAIVPVGAEPSLDLATQLCASADRYFSTALSTGEIDPAASDAVLISALDVPAPGPSP